MSDELVKYACWIRITGGGAGGNYAWTAVENTPDGWEDVPELGHGTADDDPAVEADGVSDLATDPGPVVWALRLDGGMLLFRWAGARRARI